MTQFLKLLDWIDINKLDDDFIDECHAANDASVVKKLLAKRVVR